MGARTSRTPPSQQGSLFDAGPAMPGGMRYAAEFISAAEERELLAQCTALPLQPFVFHGWLGKRETMSFGWRYDFNQSRMFPAAPIPDFLLPLRARAAAFAGLEPAAFEQALIIRYEVGAGIGWHRDRPVFDRVAGISLLSSCVLRFRLREGGRFSRFALDAEPRSAYLLTGASRDEWEHSIAPVESRRISITFRSRRAA
jgi:DNA oxidative demethylase